ncbi:MAG: hypothetical protein ACD_5C00281G0001 [uncultured bacterium]|nr:MAG: hypothetical protein ACD_5C00281G0001 [uncultured bacterium]
MVGIAEKIEEIRRKPEHVRVKYVWGCVAASMLLIITIWFFSIAAMLKKDAPKTEMDNIENLKTQLKDINEQTPSIKDIGQEVLTAGEGIKSDDMNADLQYPLPSETEDVLKSSAYTTE